MDTNDPLPPSWDRLVRKAAGARPAEVDVSRRIRQALENPPGERSSFPEEILALFQNAWFRPALAAVLLVSAAAAWMGVSSYEELASVLDVWGVWIGGVS